MRGEGKAGTIGGISGGASVARRPAAAGRGGDGGGGFRVPVAAAGSADASAAPLRGIARAQPAAALGGVLAVQEGTAPGQAPAERDRRAARRGIALIEELRWLQARMLGRDEVGPTRLARLAALAGEAGESAADPGLREAVAAIALRARVELARLGLAAPLSPR